MSRGNPKTLSERIIMKTTKSAVKKTAKLAPSKKVEWPLLDFLELTPKQVGEASKIMSEIFESELKSILGERGKWKVDSEIKDDTWTFRCHQKKDTITLVFSLVHNSCYPYRSNVSEKIRKEYVIRLTEGDAYIHKLDQHRTLVWSESVPMFIKRGEKVKGNIPGLLSILAGAISHYTSIINKIDKLNGSELVPTNTGCNFAEYSAKISNDKYGYTFISLLNSHFSEVVRVLSKVPNSWIFLRQEDVPTVTESSWWSESEGSHITTYCIDNNVIELKLELRKKFIRVSVFEWKKSKGELDEKQILKAKKKTVIDKEVIKFDQVLGQTEKYTYDWKAWKRVMSKSLTLWA